MPIDVKVRRVGRAGPILQDIRPPWVRVAYAHVVGYGVQKQSHAPGSQGVTENVKVPVSPKLRIELAVIANVIAVGAARSSFQKGRGVAVADTEVVQVIEQRGGIREGEATVELQAVGSARDAFGCQRFFGRGDNAILFHHCPVWKTSRGAERAGQQRTRGEVSSAPMLLCPSAPLPLRSHFIVPFSSGRINRI